MVQKMKILQETLEFVENIEKSKLSDLNLDLARRAKRAVSMMLSQGIIDTILFGYSKCGNNLVLEFLKQYKLNKLNKEEVFKTIPEDKMSEEVIEWGLVLLFLLYYPFHNLKLIDRNRDEEAELLALLKKLIGNKVERTKIANVSARYLSALVRLWEGKI